MEHDYGQNDGARRAPSGAALHTGPEYQLQARVAELEAELRARDDFLAIAAHELRNPMTPIRGRVELLLARARRTPDAAPRWVVQGLERLEKLVDAYIRRATILLDVARINSDNLTLQSAPLDLSAIVRRVVGTMGPAAERAGSRLSLKVQDGITGHGDETATEQILENLLSNAIRYGCAEPIGVTLLRNGDVARLSVCDRGIGISERDQAQIFERFCRLDPATTNGGFGVGLWVTRRLVHAMRGDIAVSSKPGAGSTFTVTMPLSSDKQANAD